MWRAKLLRFSLARSLVLTAWGVTLWAAPLRSGETSAPDPVEALQEALGTGDNLLDAAAVQSYKLRLEKLAGKVVLPADLRRALVLVLGQGMDDEIDAGRVREAIRKDLEKRLAKTLRDELQKGDTSHRLAALTFIAEMAAPS